LPAIGTQIQQQRTSAQQIEDILIRNGLAEKVWYSENAYMLLARCDNPEQLSKYFAKHGIETATHFAKTIEWAKQFGYTDGQCPMAENLTKELVMIPTYKRIML
jgi:dTDP-4-amino-4,6-dideoxygalactose transaminase